MKGYLLILTILCTSFFPFVTPEQLSDEKFIYNAGSSDDSNKLFIQWDEENPLVVIYNNDSLSSTFGELYQAMETNIVSIEGASHSHAYQEVTPNTQICLSNVGLMELKLFYFFTLNMNIVGNGWDYTEFNSSSGAFEGYAEYTIYNRALGDTVFIKLHSNSTGLHLESNFRFSNPDQEAQDFPPILPNSGLGQFRYDEFRISVLHHSMDDLLMYCQLVNGANIAFRDIGIFISIQELEYVNPNNNVDPYGAPKLNWNRPNCANNQYGYDWLRHDITTYHNSKSTSSSQKNWFFPHSDTSVYIHYDNGANSDGLNWNTPEIGCANNFYYRPGGFENATNGIGGAWIDVDHSLLNNNVFFEYHSSLLAHELGHTLGAQHNDAVDASVQQCKGNGVLTNTSAHNSIMREGAQISLRCYSLPYFSDEAIQKMDWGGWKGLPYQTHIPILNTPSYLLSQGNGIYSLSTSSARVSINNPFVNYGDVFWKVQYMFEHSNSNLFQICDYGISAEVIDPMSTSVIGVWNGDWNGELNNYCYLAEYSSGNYSYYYQSSYPPHLYPLLNLSDLNGDGALNDYNFHPSCLNSSGPCSIQIKPIVYIGGIQVQVNPNAIINWIQIS